MKKITIKMIAEMAGVDKAVVSKIVNRVEKIPVSVEKRRLVEKIIAENNYIPNGVAQSLSRQRTRQIAFFLSSSTELGMANETFADIFSGALSVCRENNYQCQTDICDFSDILNFTIPENMLKRTVDGCILTGDIRSEIMEKIAAVNFPAVVVGAESIRSVIPVISRSRQHDYPVLMRYLKERGHRKILIFGAKRDSRECYIDVAEKTGDFELEFVEYDGRCEFKAGMEEAMKFAMRPPENRPTFIFASSQFCYAFMNKAASVGVRCPDDFSIMSYAESSYAPWTIPPLSVFSQDAFQNGVAAGKLLLKIIEEHLDRKAAAALASEYKFAASFTERGSVRNLNEKRSGGK